MVSLSETLSRTRGSYQTRLNYTMGRRFGQIGENAKTCEHGQKYGEKQDIGGANPKLRDFLF